LSKTDKQIEQIYDESKVIVKDFSISEKPTKSLLSTNKKVTQATLKLDLEYSADENDDNINNNNIFSDNDESSISSYNENEQDNELYQNQEEDKFYTI
jgi:hypothetical protein